MPVSLNTAIFYLYNKFNGGTRHHFAVLPGTITNKEKNIVLAHLAHEDCFIPNQIGLIALNNDNPTSIDSCFEYTWHTLDDIILTEFRPTHAVDIHTFVKDFIKTKWLPDEPYRGVS